MSLREGVLGRLNAHSHYPFVRPFARTTSQDRGGWNSETAEEEETLQTLPSCAVTEFVSTPISLKDDFDCVGCKYSIPLNSAP